MSIRSRWTANVLRLKQYAASATSIDYDSLGLSRIIFGLFFLLFSWSHFSWVGTVPDAFYYPPPLSIAAFFSGFPPTLFFAVMDWLVIVSAIAMTAGCFTRTSTAMLLVVLLVSESFKFSFGKIDHGILIHATLFCMIATNWGKRLSVDQWLSAKWRTTSSDTPQRGSLALFSLLIAFGFFSAGARKCLNWIDFDLSTNGFLYWLYTGYYTLNRRHLLAEFAVNLRPIWIFELADYAAVVFELGFLLARLNGRLWRVWLVGAALFHLTITLVFNIRCIPFIPVYLCFVDWNGLFPAVMSWLQHHLARFLVVLLAVLLLLGSIHLSAEPVLLGAAVWLTGIDTQSGGYFLLGAILWILTLVVLVFELVRYSPSKNSK